MLLLDLPHCCEPGLLDVTVTDQDQSTVVIALSGDIDMDNADHLTHVTERAVATRCPVIALDLAGVTFLGSAGVKALADAHHHAHGHGSTLVLRNLQPMTHRVLEIVGLLDLLGVSSGPPPSTDQSAGAPRSPVRARWSAMSRSFTFML